MHPFWCLPGDSFKGMATTDASLHALVPKIQPCRLQSSHSPTFLVSQILLMPHPSILHGFIIPTASIMYCLLHPHWTPPKSSSTFLYSFKSHISFFLLHALCSPVCPLLSQQHFSECISHLHPVLFFCFFLANVLFNIIYSPCISFPLCSPLLRLLLTL